MWILLEFYVIKMYNYYILIFRKGINPMAEVNVRSLKELLEVIRKVQGYKQIPMKVLEAECNIYNGYISKMDKKQNLNDIFKILDFLGIQVILSVQDLPQKELRELRFVRTIQTEENENDELLDIVDQAILIVLVKLLKKKMSLSEKERIYEQLKSFL